MPQGVMINLWREIAAGRPGLITKVGLGTFVDPRVEGGKMNAATTDDYVKVVEFEGEEYLFYKSFPVDVALIRGTVADEDGNLTVDKESIHVESLALAEAAKNSGGIVIVSGRVLGQGEDAASQEGDGSRPSGRPRRYRHPDGLLLPDRRHVLRAFVRR